MSPDTVLRWQRRRFREHWTKLSDRPRLGRPPISAETAALIRKMAATSPLWGAPRIHGELLKLGIDVAERTVSRLLPRPRRSPSQTWRTFLANHVRDLVSLDFFTVPTARLRVLFVLVVLVHHRRRVVHFNVTEHPTAHWTAQQIVDAFPDDSAPAYLLRDRDSVYGHVFRQRVKGMGIGEVLTAPHCPWQNPLAERLIGSIRRECLNHVLVLGERHLRRTLARYFAYYHRARTHAFVRGSGWAHSGWRPAFDPLSNSLLAFLGLSGQHRPSSTEWDELLAKDSSNFANFHAGCHGPVPLRELFRGQTSRKRSRTINQSQRQESTGFSDRDPAAAKG